jgi:hypothetical protein
LKTADELGLSAEQFSALHSTLAALKAGTIVHLDENANTDILPDDPKRLFFNMDSWNDSIYGGEDYDNHCGSVCCIGGTAEFIAGRTLFENIRFYHGDNDKIKNLRYLFFPWEHPLYDDNHHTIDGNGITLEQAIQALTNYLETGDSQWPSIYAGKSDWI